MNCLVEESGVVGNSCKLLETFVVALRLNDFQSSSEENRLLRATCMVDYSGESILGLL